MIPEFGVRLDPGHGLRPVEFAPHLATFHLSQVATGGTISDAATLGHEHSRAALAAVVDSLSGGLYRIHRRL